MWITSLGFVQFCLTWLYTSLLLKLPEKQGCCLGWSQYRTLLVPACEISQSCRGGSVVCCPCSGVCPFLQWSPDCQDAELERICRDSTSCSSWVLILHMFWVYFCYGGIQPYCLRYVWSVQNEVASPQRVLDHLLLALFLRYRIYFLSVNDLWLDTPVIC